MCTLKKTFPSKKAIATAHLAKLTNVLKKKSRGKYSKSKALLIRETATNFIGTDSRALSFELSQTIALIKIYTSEIDKINSEIKISKTLICSTNYLLLLV